MKVLLLTVLLLLLCTTQVFTLRCFTCNGEGEGDSICKTETDCPASSQYCRTYRKQDVLERTCEPFCAEDFYTTCCQTDLC